MQFTGQVHDNATGLDNFKARYYSPMLGRFLTPDPGVPSGPARWGGEPAGLAAASLADPQTLNRYAYVGNDPLGAMDPSGLVPEAWPIPPGEDGPDAGNCTIDGISADCGWAESMVTPGLRFRVS